MTDPAAHLLIILLAAFVVAVFWRWGVNERERGLTADGRTPRKTGATFEVSGSATLPEALDPRKKGR
jgi:hypothetical protein